MKGLTAEYVMSTCDMHVLLCCMNTFFSAVIESITKVTIPSILKENWEEHENYEMKKEKRKMRDRVREMVAWEGKEKRRNEEEER